MKSGSRSACLNRGALVASVLCFSTIFVALVGSGIFGQLSRTTGSGQLLRSNAIDRAPVTQAPDGCNWSAGADMPNTLVRSVGVFFPDNGKFYAMGVFTHPFEYDPLSNTWTTKAATYPDEIVDNMACGVLNEAGVDYIYCVGGSQVVTNLVTGRVFRYDPVADAVTVVAAPWPPGVN